MPSNEALESKKTEEKPSNSPAPESTKKPEDQTLDENESKKSGSTEQIDFKALLEEEKSKLARAEEKIVKLKKLGKKEVPTTNEDEDEEQDEDNKVRKLVANQVEKIRDQVRGEIVESEVDDLLSELSSNQDEKGLIRHIYENRLQKSGFSRAKIREDLENAKILANKSSLLKSNKELSEALKSKATTQTSPNFVSGARETAPSGPQYTPEERALLERYGVKIK